MSSPVIDPNAPDPVAPDAPTQNLPGQVSLALVALATIAGFIWHKDFTSILPAIGTLATAIIGAALAIEHAWKYRTYVHATAIYNDQLLSTHHYRVVSAREALLGSATGRGPQ